MPLSSWSTEVLDGTMLEVKRRRKKEKERKRKNRLNATNNVVATQIHGGISGEIKFQSCLASLNNGHVKQFKSRTSVTLFKILNWSNIPNSHKSKYDSLCCTTPLKIRSKCNQTSIKHLTVGGRLCLIPMESNTKRTSKTFLQDFENIYKVYYHSIEFLFLSHWSGACHMTYSK